MLSRILLKLVYFFDIYDYFFLKNISRVRLAYGTATSPVLMELIDDRLDNVLPLKGGSWGFYISCGLGVYFSIYLDAPKICLIYLWNYS